MTCRRCINSAQLHHDLTKTQPVVIQTTAKSTEDVEPSTQAKQDDLPEEDSDGETASRSTPEPSGHQTTMSHWSTD